MFHSPPVPDCLVILLPPHPYSLIDRSDRAERCRCSWRERGSPNGTGWISNRPLLLPRCCCRCGHPPTPLTIAAFAAHTHTPLHWRSATFQENAAHLERSSIHRAAAIRSPSSHCDAPHSHKSRAGECDGTRAERANSSLHRFAHRSDRRQRSGSIACVCRRRSSSNSSSLSFCSSPQRSRSHRTIFPR